jgi:hypothetical protein
MAAHFAKRENWFSQALGVVGLGRPGLWGVSVGLGLIGALMVITAHRQETGYALGLVTMLLAVFGASYLVVRGVKPSKVLTPLLLALPLFLLLLLLPETPLFDWTWSLSRYQVFTAAASALTVFVLLRHQASVSDHVLWMGSVGLTVLFTILIPADSRSTGGDGGLLLLGALSLLQLGTAVLAGWRRSPSLAGVTVLVPWVWIISLGLYHSSVETFNLSKGAEVLDASIVQVDGWFLVGYMLLSVLIQYPVNRLLGSTGVNLAARLVGLSEVGARLRDSGLLRLWNLGYLIALAGMLLMARPGLLPGYGLLLVLGALFFVHVLAQCEGRHQENPRLLLTLFAIAALIEQWRHGMDAAWMFFVALGGAALLMFYRGEKPQQLLTQLMFFIAVQVIILRLNTERIHASLLDTPPLLDVVSSGWVAVASVALALSLYLPRASRLEELLKPAGAAVFMLVALIWTTFATDSSGLQTLLAVVFFLGSGVWLAAQGEIRAELKAVSRKDRRIERFEKMHIIQKQLAQGVPSEGVAQAQHTTGSAAGDSAAFLSLPVDTAIQSEAATAKSSTQMVADTQADGTPSTAGGDLLPIVDHSGMEEQLADSSTTRTYHFSDDELARSAAGDQSGELARSLSQAISTGGMRMVSGELADLKEKQKKRLKRSGSSGDQDLILGDIHHRPVVVLTFITGILLFSIWQSLLNSTLAMGLLLFSSICSIGLIFISRWRASANNLSLPDLMGLESPFAWTMIGISILYFTSHVGIGSSNAAQLDLLILAATLTVLAVISLVGRSDLALRIPSAIEWIVYCLLGSRLLLGFFAGTQLFPLNINPFAAPGTPPGGEGTSLFEWTIPWFAVDVLLILLVLVWDWIERVRKQRSLPDHRGAAGRGMWVMMITLISLGPAALLAVALGLRRAFQWRQPAAAALAILALVAAWLALEQWIEFLDATLGWLMLGLGSLMVLSIWITVLRQQERWTSAWVWNAHLLLPLGTLVAFNAITGWLALSLLCLSLSTWVAGIIQLRRGLRAFGAFDLVLSIIAASLAMKGDLLDPTMLLLVLCALGLVLGIVAWLGQRHQEQLSVD